MLKKIEYTGKIEFNLTHYIEKLIEQGNSIITHLEGEKEGEVNKEFEKTNKSFEEFLSKNPHVVVKGTHPIINFFLQERQSEAKELVEWLEEEIDYRMCSLNYYVRIFR